MAIQKLTRILDAVNEWIGQSLAWLIWVVMGFCVFEVITRRIFNAPNIWTVDVTSLFYALHFMVLAGYTLKHNGHVSVDIIYQRFSPRVKVVLKLFTYLLFFFPFVIVLLYVGYNSAASSWGFRERTSIGLPLITPILKSITPVTALLLLVQGISEFIKAIVDFPKGEIRQ
jgi:TRAP-type mannitol/chloroaromatic compound transport system permease small subunit